MIKFFLLLFFSPFFLYAQEKLLLNQAIETAIKNNYSILISKNESTITKNDVTIGNAGFLPQITLNSSGNLSSNDTKQKLANETIIDKQGAGSNNLGSNITMTWTLFDGMKMFVTYQKLKEQNEISFLNLKKQIEETVFQVITSYYEIVSQKQLLIAMDSSLAIYDERVKITELKWNIGNGSKSEYLQALVDRNAQKSNRLKQESTISSTKIKLNQILSLPAENIFDVTDEIEINKNLQLEEIKNSIYSQNTSLLFYQKNKIISDFTLKELRSQRYPRLSLNTNYNFSRTDNQAGYLLYNRNLGWNLGLTATWTIFNGFNINRTIRNAEISLMNSGLLYEKTKTEIESGLLTAYKNYQMSLKILVLEEENVRLANENVTIMIERFRFGEANSLEMKEAQRSYENALSRLIEVKYEAKTAETTLIKMKGELIK